MALAYVPTLYKARNLPLKRPVCAICVDRTRGRTECVQLGYRVSVWLCPAHADPGFQTRRGGRDFVRTLAGVWQASGCLTAARDRALNAHMARQRELPGRPRPGSYAWPQLRRRLEQVYAGGAQPAQVAGGVRALEESCPARPPSRRTLQRWYSQRRWISRPP